MIFVHGLSGHITDTWSTRDQPPVLWPKWLVEHIEGIAVWGLGYDSAKSNWTGSSLSTPDLAENLLQQLRLEKRLKSGRIIFVGHSLGGIVIESILRVAERDAKSDAQIEDFLNRVRRVAFIGTPHRGLLMAGIGEALRLVARPSNASRDLTPENPGLRGLNHWYRAFSRDHSIENLVLIEGKAERPFGLPLTELFAKIVQPSSADPGLSELPITIHEDHTNISRPASMDALVYKLVRDFVSKPFGGEPRQVRMAQAIDENTRSIDQNTTMLELLRRESRGTVQAVDQLARSVAESVTRGNASDLIDAEVKRQLELMRTLRLFGQQDTIAEARSLANSLLNGNLSSATKTTKDEALAWCSRFLSVNAAEEAQALLAGVDGKLAPTKIAHALIFAAQGDLPKALGTLAETDTPIASGAAYITILRTNGAEAASTWLANSSKSLSDIDSDAKFFHLKALLEAEEWDAAVEIAKVLTDEDFDRTPSLILLAADAHMLQAVPAELRMFLLQYLPLDTPNFPLSVEAAALQHRRTAITLYERIMPVATALSLPSVYSIAHDKNLWLRLKDPQTQAQARQELAETLKNPAELLNSYRSRSSSELTSISIASKKRLTGRQP